MSGSNYLKLKAPDNISSNLTLTLPSADGSSGQVLQTDGSGNLSFATVQMVFAATSLNGLSDVTYGSNRILTIEDLETMFLKAIHHIPLN